MRRPARAGGALALLAALAGACLSALSAPAAGAGSAASGEPADAVHAAYADGVRGFRDEIGRFRAAAGRDGDSALRAGLHRLRDAYKGIEFLVERLHPGSAVLLNGPPLFRSDPAERGSAELIAPQGLQVLEEEVYADGAGDGAARRARLAALAARLDEAARDLDARSRTAVLDDREIFEAMEGQVVRVMTLGIAGFDTPASGQALRESRLSLLALRPALRAYGPALRRRDAALADRLERALDLAAERLARGPGFDAFDRLGFIRAAGNPLYAALVDAHHVLGIAVLADLIRAAPPVNPRARGLFDRDFLDPYAYSDAPGEASRPEAVALGRRLFFETALSGDRRRSCASCHRPDLGFADGLPRSLAAAAGDGTARTLQRNAPGLAYAGYQASQFWDTRARFLEDQVGHVIHGDREFGTDYATLLGRLRADPEYVGRFRAAFPRRPGGGGADGGNGGPDDPVTAGALAQYMRSLAPFDSPFDRYMRGETDSLDPAAARGFNLFMGKAACGTCHFPPAFNGTVPPLYLETETEVLGTPGNADTLRPEPDPDPGRFHQKPSPVHRGAFKTPTVRNAALTAPYMHNGVFATLEEVMRFYNVGGGRGLGLDVPHQTLPADSLGLSRGEIGDLVAFLRALGDACLTPPGTSPRSAPCW